MMMYSQTNWLMVYSQMKVVEDDQQFSRKSYFDISPNCDHDMIPQLMETYNHTMFRHKWFSGFEDCPGNQLIQPLYIPPYTGINVSLRAFWLEEIGTTSFVTKLGCMQVCAHVCVCG